MTQRTRSINAARRVSWAERRPAREVRRWNGVTLEPDERIVLEVRRSAFWAVLTLIVLTLLVPLLWPLPVAVWWGIKQNRYAVTDKRVMVREGVFSKQAMQVRLEQITDVSVRRPFLCSILHHGSVMVATAGGPTKEITIPWQPNPDRVADALRRYH